MAKSGVELVVRTNDERPSIIRGERRWSKVEVTGDRWFQVETRGDKHLPFRTYILPNIESALDLLTNLRRDSWTQLRLYTRVPLSIVDGFIFETVRQVFRTPEGTHIFLLKSGLILCDTNHAVTEGLSLTEAEEIYCRT